jgi:hypothetical protein
MAAKFIDGPEDLTPQGELSESQAIYLKTGTRLVAPVPYPTDPAVMVGVRAVSRETIEQARAQARLDAIDLLQGKVEDMDVVGLCFRDLVVAGAFVVLDPKRRGAGGTWSRYVLRADEEPDPLFPSVNDVRRRCSSQEVEDLWKIFEEHEALVCPLAHAERFEPERVREIVEHLKKEPESPLLSILPPEMLVAMLRFMASAASAP